MSDSERLAVVEEVVLRIERRLFGGDGRPGELSELERRISTLERWHLKLIGGMVALGVAMQLIDLFWKRAT